MSKAMAFASSLSDLWVEVEAEAKANEQGPLQLPVARLFEAGLAFTRGFLQGLAR
jgi:hypothetical protein